MAETQQEKAQPQPTTTPAQGKRAESAPPTAAAATGESVTFGDGSTQAQQDQLVREAEETNRLIKEAGDAEREARSS